MRLACPCCGAVASLEAWTADEDARRALVAVMDMPGELSRLTAKYLALFRDPGSKRGLAWGKALRLIEELRELAMAKETSWEGQTAACIPTHWMQGIEVLLERDAAGKVTRPLKNHNLLRAIVFERASRAAAQVEAKREETRRKQAMHRPAQEPGRTDGPSEHYHAKVGSPDWEAMQRGLAGWKKRQEEQGKEPQIAPLPTMARVPVEESETQARDRLMDQLTKLARWAGEQSGEKQS